MTMLTLARLTLAILVPRVLPVVVNAVEAMLIAQREQPCYEPGKGERLGT